MVTEALSSMDFAATVYARAAWSIRWRAVVQTSVGVDSFALREARSTLLEDLTPSLLSDHVVSLD